MKIQKCHQFVLFRNMCAPDLAVVHTEGATSLEEFAYWYDFAENVFI